MNILFLSDNFPPEVSASATRVYERALYWVKWGHSVTVITCAPNFPEGKIYPGYKNRWYQAENIDGIRVIRVKTFMSKNSGFLLRLLDFLSYMLMATIVSVWQQRPDVVMATSPQFFAAVGGWVISLIKWRPFVFEVSDLWPASIKAVGAMKNSILLSMIERVELFLYRRAAKIVVLTNAFRKDLMRRGIPGDKISVILNGVDLHRYTPVSKHANLLELLNLSSKFIVGYLGTLGLAQNLQRVLLVANYFKTNPNIHFLFLGDGADKEKLISIANRLSLCNVTFINQCPKADMPKYWSICDLALVHLKDDPVFSEVIPSKIFEAIGMGIPIFLVSPEGEASKLVLENEIGWWISSKNLNDFSDGLLQAVTQQDVYQQCKKRCPKIAQKFSREMQAKRCIYVLSDVIMRASLKV